MSRTHQIKSNLGTTASRRKTEACVLPYYAVPLGKVGKDVHRPALHPIAQQVTDTPSPTYYHAVNHARRKTETCGSPCHPKTSPLVHSTGKP